MKELSGTETTSSQSESISQSDNESIAHQELHTPENDHPTPENAPKVPLKDTDSITSDQSKSQNTKEYSSSESKEIPTPSVTFKGPPEMAQISTLLYSVSNKFYYCGFVYKLNAVNANGKALFRNVTQIQSDGFWSKWWMEQWGPVLHLWRVPDELSSFAYTTNLSTDRFIKNELDPPMELMAAIKSFQQTPLFINFADASIELFDAGFQAVGFANTPPPPIPYTCHFALSTTSSNLFVFASSSTIQANQWVASMRLALFETHRLNSIFTNRLMRKPTMMTPWQEFQIEPFTSQKYRGDIKYEGPLQIRIPYSNTWKQLHVVVTSKYGTEAYASTGISKKIFKKKASMVDLSKRGSILFYSKKDSASKGKPPLFVMYDVKFITAIWPDQAEEFKIESLCMAKIEGAFRMHSLKSTEGNGDYHQSGKRTFGNFGSGFNSISTLEQFGDIVDGRDRRPVPHQLLIMAPNSAELSRWITGVWCSFSIDPQLTQLEDEIHEMTKFPEPNERDEEQQEIVQVKWPTQMYLSLTEVGGITMGTTSLVDSFSEFSHYLLQKVNFSKDDRMRQWCEAVAKGEWERNICDRKELDYKIKQLTEWSNRICEKLNSVGIETKKPHPTVLVTAMTSIINWIGPVLSSMIDEVKSPIRSEFGHSEGSTADSKSVTTSSSVSKASAKKLVSSSGSEGSVSEEERSDDGSLSEDESGSEDERALAFNPAMDNRRPSDTSSSQDVEEFQVYAPNSLLAQVAENENLPKQAPKQTGPFITTKAGPETDIQYAQNSLLAKPNQNRMSIANTQANNRNSALIPALPFPTNFENPDGLVQKIGQSGIKKEIQGPLLGSLAELDKKKPRLEGGLLGEMDRRAKEVEYLKKMGIYKAAGAGPAGLISLPHVQGETPMDTYNREMFRQQLLTQERMRSTGGQEFRPHIFQMNNLIQQMSNALIVAQSSNPVLVQNLQKIVSQMSVVMNQLTIQAQSPSGTPGPYGGMMNPYAVPNLTWKQSNSATSSSISSRSFLKNRAPSSVSSRESSEYDSNGSRIQSSSYNSSSGTESYSSKSFRSGSTETPTSATDSLDEDVPLIKLKKNRNPKAIPSSSTETDTSSFRKGSSNGSSSDESDSSEGSQSEESNLSDESSEVPLALLKPTNNNTQNPLTYQITSTPSGQQSNYQRYLMSQQNAYARQYTTPGVISSTSPVPSISSNLPLSKTNNQATTVSAESLNATPKPRRKRNVVAEDSSEGSVSEESD